MRYNSFTVENFELDCSSPDYLRVEAPKKTALDLTQVSWTSSYDLLKKCAALGTLSFKGKKLVVDLFSKVPFTYTLQEEANGLFKLSGMIGLKEPITIEKCTFISPSRPSWFITGLLLKVFDEEVSGAKLAKLPLLLTRDELLDRIERESLPLTLPSHLQVDPLPVLTLADSTGAFANLWMEYGPGKRLPYPPREQLTDKTRLPEKEKHWENDLLETGYLKKQVASSSYYCAMDKVGKSLSFLLEMGWKILDAKNRQVLLETGRQLEVEAAPHASKWKGRITFGAYEADLDKVTSAFNRREKFIELGEGAVGWLQEDLLLQALAEEGEIVQGGIKLPLYKAGSLPDEAKNWIDPGPLKELLTKKPSIKPLPASFLGQLRPYQAEGTAWLKTLYESGLGGVLGDEMGLGKTVQVLGFLSTLDPSKKHLITVPTSLLFNWRNECERFLPSLAVYLHAGPDRSATLDTFPEASITLTSYHVLRSDRDLLKRVPWECHIIDEAQYVKNPDSLTAQALYAIPSRFRVCMSGTLIENHPKELWAHFHFLLPGMLGAREDFERQCQLSSLDSRYSRHIQKKVVPFILRRKKEEVAKDLPSLDEQIVFVDMEDKQRELYEKWLVSSKQGLLRKVSLDNKNHRLAIFEIILRLRQIACHPLLFNPLDLTATESGKMEALMLDLETIREEGKKALIFSQFAQMLHLIGHRLTQEGIPFCLLEGATQNREKEVIEFQENKDIPFFLISLKAGGTGLNLTAADYVLLYDPWWHEAAESQAISRAHRIGQTKPVIAKRYIASHSIEEKMLTLKRAKKALFKDLTENDPHLPDFSLEDLELLL